MSHREALAAAQAKLVLRNPEVRRLRDDVAAQACRVALLSEEDTKLPGGRPGPVGAGPAPTS